MSRYTAPGPKVCKACGVRKQPAEFDPAGRWPDGSIRWLASKCKPCRRMETATSMRARYETDEEARRAKHRARWEKLKADPQRHAEALQKRRERWALRQMERGITPQPLRLVPDPPMPDVPAFPLAQAIVRIARRENAGLLETDGIYTGVILRSGVSDRTFRRWRDSEDSVTEFDIADRALLNLGLLWWEVWPPEDFPHVAAIFEPEAVAA